MVQIWQQMECITIDKDILHQMSYVIVMRWITFTAFIPFTSHAPINTHQSHFHKHGGPRGRVGKVAVFQRSQSFDHLTAVSGVGSSPALATCETRQVLLAGVSGGFPGVLPFPPTYRLARPYE